VVSLGIVILLSGWLILVFVIVGYVICGVHGGED
jgi:hypothetical protein